MSDNTKIEWSDATWNPVTGCTEVSPGCDHCYAKTFAERWRGVPGHHFEHGFDLTLRPERLDQPLRWKKPRRIFVNSMSDLFHDQVPAEYIAKVFAVMSQAPQHTFQVLTKRHGRMRALLASEHFQTDAHSRAIDLVQSLTAEHEFRWPLPNVWLGVSVEDQRWAGIRIPALLDTPAAVRFLSCEPLLGPVNIRTAVRATGRQYGCGGQHHGIGTRECPRELHHHHDERCRMPMPDWVIVGGESGPGARPMHPDWARSLRDQCSAAGVPFVFKQWGEWVPGGFASGRALKPNEQLLGAPGDDRRRIMVRLGKGRAGRHLDGRTWDEFPEVSR